MMVLRFLLGLLLISFGAAGNPYVVFQENGKAGLKSSDGKIIIPAQYDGIGWSNGKFTIIENVTGFRIGKSWGLINLGNQKLTKDQFTDLYPAGGGLLVAGKVPKNSSRAAMGVITTSGKNVIPFLYDGIAVSNFRAIVFTQIGNQFRYGLIDLENKTLIPQQFQDVRSVGTLRYAVRNFEGKTALFSENGQKMTEFVIDSISLFRNNYAVIFQERNKGLIDRTGVVKLDPKFRDIDFDNSNEVRVRQADEWIFLESDNKKVRSVLADSVSPLGNGSYKILTANVAQMVDKDFQPIKGSLLTDIRPFKNGKAVYQLGPLYGVILSDGKLLIPALYQDLIIEKDFILASQRTVAGKTWILFDTLGVRKAMRPYQSIKPLENGMFVVQHRGFFGLINASGREVVACAYDSILGSDQGKLLVKFKGLYGVISTEEEWLVAPRPNKITLVSRDRFLEHTPTSNVLKERNGSIIYFTSNRIAVYTDHLLEFLPSGTRWKIDFNGVIIDRQVAPAEGAEIIYEESEGYRAIKRNGRFGFIDNRSRLRIANRYEAVQNFSEGYAAVKILGKWGYINLQDNIAIQPVYEEVFPFSNGVAKVKQKGLFGLVDKKGKLVLPVRYERVDVLPSGNFRIKSGAMVGLANPAGRILIHPKYDFIQDNNNGHAIAGKDGLYGLINYNGVATIPMMYTCLRFDSASGRYMALKKAPWQKITIH